MKKLIQSTPKETAQAFAEYLVEKQKDAKSIKIALSGGSTPKLLFDILAKDYAQKIDWNKIHLFWGDERCVAPTDDQSNYKMTLEHLISKVAIPETNVHRILGENDPETEAKRYSNLLQTELKKGNNLPQFDIIMLGLGEDGHTASIFPNQMELLTSSVLCAVATHPDSGQQRVTLTGKVINNAKAVCFLVTGTGKADKVEEIMHQEGGYKTYPAYYIQPTSDNLLWFMDEAASVKL
uniref:6-phosphogluconolactonase n=2 Tax=Roseivirga sp. TaxID=1964215 RepID=UPI00404778C3